MMGVFTFRLRSKFCCSFIYLLINLFHPFFDLSLVKCRWDEDHVFIIIFIGVASVRRESA